MTADLLLSLSGKLKNLGLLYAFAANRLPQENLHKFFNNLSKRRKGMSQNVYLLLEFPYKTEVEKLPKLKDAEKLVSYCITQEQELFAVYERLLDQTELSDFKLRILKIHYQEVKASLSSMQVLLPYYIKQQLAA